MNTLFNGLKMVAGALLLAGCVSSADEQQLASDPNYGIGYSDGCHTAGTRVQGFDKTITRDNELFDSSKAYQSGWRAGYGSCGGEQFRDRDVFGFEDRVYDTGSVGATY